MREEQSGDQTGTKIDVNDVRHIPENFQEDQCERIKQAKEHSMQSQENTESFDDRSDRQDLASKIDENTLTHTEPHETARDAEKIETSLNGKETEVNAQGMSDWQKQGIDKIKELRENGRLKSVTERFVENPRIHRAVRRFCWECNGFSNSLANTCPNSNCPLWLFRHGRTIVRGDELPVWQNAHKRWLQKVGEWKPGTSDGNEPDEADEAADD